MLLLDETPSLAAFERRGRVLKQRATCSFKNRVWGFSATGSGRISSCRPLRRRTATGYRGCGYKTVSGRAQWLSRDPIAEAGGINLYGYVGNNPINLIDPLGLAWAEMNPSARENYELAKRYVSLKSKEGADMFNRIEVSPIVYHLAINDQKINHFDPYGDVNLVQWDPHSALMTAQCGRQSPALGLIHEIDHALAWSNPRAVEDRRKISNSSFKDDEERRVITGAERRIANALGENSRVSWYSRGEYRVEQPWMR